jgi:hypothetical protein
MSAMRVRCPHCEGEIRLDVDLEAVGTHRSGPKPHEMDPEIQAFIIQGIEVYHSSFATVAKLLEEKNVLTSKGSPRWFSASVKREYEKAIASRRVRQAES